MTRTTILLTGLILSTGLLARAATVTGETVTTPVAVLASVAETKAAGGAGDFPPEKTIDGDLAPKSSWRAEVTDEKAGQWIQYDLGAVLQVSAVRLAFLSGEERVYRFQLELSADGEQWTTAYTGASSGKVKGYETFTISPTAARYVRARGFGNSNEKFPHWFNIVETQILTGGE